jgi:hypothetical protein
MDTDTDGKNEFGERSLFVPVHLRPHGSLTLRTGRLPSGERIGIAFTSRLALAATLGPRQSWIPMRADLVALLYAGVGIEQTRVDPLPLRTAARTTSLQRMEPPHASHMRPTSAAPALVPTADSSVPDSRHRPRHRTRPVVRHAY